MNLIESDFQRRIAAPAPVTQASNQGWLRLGRTTQFFVCFVGLVYKSGLVRLILPGANRDGQTGSHKKTKETKMVPCRMCESLHEVKSHVISATEEFCPAPGLRLLRWLGVQKRAGAPDPSRREPGRPNRFTEENEGNEDGPLVVCVNLYVKASEKPCNLSHRRLLSCARFRAPRLRSLASAGRFANPLRS
jgi:hypothetical protein